MEARDGVQIARFTKYLDVATICYLFPRIIRSINRAWGRFELGSSRSVGPPALSASPRMRHEHSPDVGTEVDGAVTYDAYARPNLRPEFCRLVHFQLGAPYALGPKHVALVLDNLAFRDGQPDDRPPARTRREG